MPLTFVTIRDKNGRASSLEISNKDTMEVIGGLQHCADIKPESIEDAKKLRDWLNDWIVEAERS